MCVYKILWIWTLYNDLLKSKAIFFSLNLLYICRRIVCRLGQYLFRRYTSYFFSWGTKIIFCSYNLHCGENIDLNVSHRVLWVLILISLQTHPPPPHATIFICYYRSIEFLRENNPAITCCGCSIIASMVLECLTQRAGTKTTLSQVISAADICHQKDVNTVIWENVLLKKNQIQKMLNETGQNPTVYERTDKGE